MKCWAPNIYIWYFCLVRTENVWGWRNQGILGVGNRHDNSRNYNYNAEARALELSRNVQ